MLAIQEKKLREFTDVLAKHFDFLDASLSQLPPKQYFLPERETTFSVKKNGEISLPELRKEFIIFGLSFRYLEAITYLDEIMKKPSPDYYYFRRRNKAILIGVTEEKILIPPGGDIILQKIKNGGYAIISATRKGEKLINKLIKLNFKFSEIKNPELKISETKTMPRLRKLLLDQELLHDAVKWSYKGYSKIWNDLAKKCLGCGICTYVCPLCHCFSVEDKTELSGKSCSRCRYWTACTLPEFARISEGHNFHKTIRERYYNWFYHKFVRAYAEFGKPQCVACGRCKKYCPARIDIEKILAEIVKEYKKHY